MLINLSNHPNEKWDIKQKEKAIKTYGLIQDMPFPAINPSWESEEVSLLAHQYFDKINLMFDQCANEPKPNAVHIQGEFTFVFKLVTLLKSSGINCIASTSKRIVNETSKGKIVQFDFVQFREY